MITSNKKDLNLVIHLTHYFFKHIRKINQSKSPTTKPWNTIDSSHSQDEILHNVASEWTLMNLRAAAMIFSWFVQDHELIILFGLSEFFLCVVLLCFTVCVQCDDITISISQKYYNNNKTFVCDAFNVKINNSKCRSLNKKLWILSVLSINVKSTHFMRQAQTQCA